MSQRERIATWPKDRANRVSARVVETLSGARTLTAAEVERYQAVAFDCNGAARDLNLPAVGTSNGVLLFVSNTTAATHALTVKNAGGSTVVAIAATKSALVWCDGVRWYALNGA